MVGYNPFQQCEPWQLGQHKLRPARLTLSLVGRGGSLEVHSELDRPLLTLFGQPPPAPFDLWASIRESQG